MTYASPTFTPDYQGLCATVADTLNRADLVTGIPNFISLATARISRDMARIRHPGGICHAIATAENNYVSLPADFISVYQLMSQDNTVVFEYISPDQSKQILANGWAPPDSPFPPAAPYSGQSTGPFYFTILGNTLRIIPPPTVSAPSPLELWYYKKVPAISATATANWVLTKYPDLYLYGALVHSAPYLKADERIATWEGAYQKILSDIEIEADRATRPQSKLVAARRSF